MKQEWKRTALQNNHAAYETIVRWNDRDSDTAEIQLTAYTENDDHKIHTSVIMLSDTVGKNYIYIDGVWFGEIFPKTVKTVLRQKQKIIVTYVNIITGFTTTLIGKNDGANNTTMGVPNVDAIRTGTIEKSIHVVIPLDETSSIDKAVNTVESLLPIIDDIIKKLQSANAQVYKSNYIANRTEKKLYEVLTEINQVKRWNIWKRLKWLIFG